MAGRYVRLLLQKVREQRTERRLAETERFYTRIAEEGEVKASRRQGSSSLMMRKLPPGAV